VLGVEKDSYQFEYQEWKELEFDKAPAYGTLETSESLFDGLGCDDHFVYPRIETAKSAIEYPLPLEEMQQLGVEFWFMREKAVAEANPLLVIANGSKEVLKVHFDAGLRLLCSPFGTDSEVKLHYQKARINLSKQWQHVACMYSKQSDLLGTYTLYSKDEVATETEFYIE